MATFLATTACPRQCCRELLEGGRKRGRQVKCWADNLKEWTRLGSPTLTRLAEDRPAWRSLSYDVSIMSPLGLQVKGLSECEHKLIGDIIHTFLSLQINRPTVHKCFITLMSSLVPHSVSLDSDYDPEGDFKASCILAAMQTVLRHDNCASNNRPSLA